MQAIATVEQQSSQSARHFGKKVPAWCPTCGRSNNWKPIGSTMPVNRACAPCGITWTTKLSKIEIVTKGEKNIGHFRNTVASVEVGQYGPKTIDSKLLQVGAVVILRSIVHHRAARDGIRSEMQVVEVA